MNENVNRDLFITETIINYLQSLYPNEYSDEEIISRYKEYIKLKSLKKAAKDNEEVKFRTRDKAKLEELNIYFYGNSDGSSTGSGNSIVNNYIKAIENIKALINSNDNAIKDVLANPGYDVYRSKGMYFFVNNIFEKESSNINNGNIYTKTYLNRIKFPDTSNGEDADITFHRNASIYESKLKHTMLYRWGMETFHISGLGEQSNQVILDHADKVLDNRTGIVELTPHFKSDYYEQINRNSK